MRGLLSAVVMIALVATPIVTRGDDDSSLGAAAEKAKRERAERRAKEGHPVKSFSDGDLKGTGSSASTTTDAASDTASGATTPESADKSAKPAAKPEKSDDEIRAEKRAELQKRIDDQRKKIEAITKVADDAQRELNDLTNFTYGGHRDALQKVVDDGAAEKAKAQQAIEAAQEEARRLGVPVS
jgi:hypothetical protein